MISRSVVVPVRPPAVTAWIAGPPALREQPSLIMAVIDDLLALLASYPIESIYSSEPRYYRLGARGRARLAESLEVGRIYTLVFSTPAHPPSIVGLDHASALFALSSKHWSDVTTHLQLTLRPADPARLLIAATGVTDFVTRWFAPLRAAAAFVSVQRFINGRDDGDWPMMTAHERQQNATVQGWLATRRHLRGAFWGMGLGSDLSDRLGGREHVLRDVPAPIVRTLGDGVWLQLSDSPPADPAALARLAEFLAPALQWSGTDLRATIEESRSQSRAEQLQDRGIGMDALEAEAAGYAARVAEDGSLAPQGDRKAVPIRGLRDAGVDVALNVYLAAPPTASQLTYLVAMVQRWYADGFEGKFGGNGFHDLTGPTIDGRVVRWQSDLGTADGARALRDLARRLAALPNITVQRLVLGTDVAG